MGKGLQPLRSAFQGCKGIPSAAEAAFLGRLIGLAEARPLRKTAYLPTGLSFRPKRSAVETPAVPLLPQRHGIHRQAVALFNGELNEVSKALKAATVKKLQDKNPGEHQRSPMPPVGFRK